MIDSALILAQQMPDPRVAWAPILVLLIVAILFTITNIAASLLIGPSRTGPGKETTYESGMVPVGDTRKRFNVRFYQVAILFVAFDVEIVLMWPWAVAFVQALKQGNVDPGMAQLSGLMFGGAAVFVAVMILGYLYDWGKGVFRWD